MPQLLHHGELVAFDRVFETIEAIGTKENFTKCKTMFALKHKSNVVVDSFKALIQQGHHQMELGPSMEDLYRVVCKIEALIQECSREDWIHASLWQMSNEEEFCELLEELHYVFKSLSEQFQILGIMTMDLRKYKDFNPR